MFISVPLEEGSHEILLEFRPPGIAAGSAVTLLCVMLLAILEFIRRRKNRYTVNRGMKLLSGTSPDVSQSGDHIRYSS